MPSPTEYRIPIAAPRRVVLTLDELDGRAVRLRPITGRVLKLYEAHTLLPTDADRLLDIVEALVGGEDGLTREEIESLADATLGRIIDLSRASLTELETAAKKDEGPAA